MVPVICICNALHYDEVISSHRGLVIVGYFANWPAKWSLPCMSFETVFDDLAKRYSDVVFIKVCAHENMEMLMQSNIQSFPTIHLLLNSVVRHVMEISAAHTPLEIKIIDYKLLQSGPGADLGSSISIGTKLMYPSKKGGYGSTGSIEEEYLLINPRDGLDLLRHQILSLTDIPTEMQLLRDSRGVDIKTDADLDAVLCKRRENVVICDVSPSTVHTKMVEASLRSPPLPSSSRLSTCTRVLLGEEPLLQPATVVIITVKSEEGHNTQQPYFLCSYCGGCYFPQDSPLIYGVGIVGNFTCTLVEALNAGVTEQREETLLPDFSLKSNDADKRDRLKAIMTLYNGFPCQQMEDSKIKFVARLGEYSKMACRYEDPELQTAALNIVPHEILSCKDNFLRVTSLLEWFKKTFKFVTKPQCWNCGEDNHINRLGPAIPTHEEAKAGEAQVVELYKCMNCGSERRFPRYNNPKMILKTQYGRCGEFANVFTLICRAANLSARLVFDWTDHLWTEVRLGERWVHADPCENKLDAPMLYESGWGKKLTYIMAFDGDGGVKDVTRRYTRNWPDVASRRISVNEIWLQNFLLCRKPIDFEDEEQEMEKYTELKSIDEVITNPEEVEGRISGDAEWVSQRGEG